jgi:hypothetical protein
MPPAILHTTKKGSLSAALEKIEWYGALGAAVAGSAAPRTSSAAGIKLDTAGKFEADVHEIDLDGFHLLHEILVDEVGKSIDFMG